MGEWSGFCSHTGLGQVRVLLLSQWAIPTAPLTSPSLIAASLPYHHKKSKEFTASIWVESKEALELDRLGFNSGKSLNASEPVSLVQMRI